MNGRDALHVPVMVGETLFYLDPKPGETAADCTCGAGGHAKEILARLLPGGRLIGIDRDAEILAEAERNLAPFAGSFELHHARFSGIEQILREPVDILLFDLGVSSFQLDQPERGFSFSAEGPLDMRMDASSGKSAAEVLRSLPEGELERIIRDYGEERYARRIAKAIKRAVSGPGIRTTAELAEVVKRASPRWERRIHPATRTFQALRLYVNEELDELQAALDALPRLLKPGGRAAVISYHSLEDRITKQTLRREAAEGSVEILTKKPVRPTLDEVSRNRRARSARLRAAKRL